MCTAALIGNGLVGLAPPSVVSPITSARPGGAALIQSVSCASAGNCSAGGYYRDSSSHGQAFVVSQISGTWQKAEEVPGTAALNKGGDDFIDAVSCTSAADCGAGGYYSSTTSHNQAFVVSKT